MTNYSLIRNNPETKCQCEKVLYWKNPQQGKKARMSKSKFKAMMIVFFLIQRIIANDWVPKGQIINQIYYKEVLTPVNVYTEKCLIYAKIVHGSFNKSTHWRTMQVHQDFWPNTKFILLIWPCFVWFLFLFPKIKSMLKGTHFESVDIPNIRGTETKKTIRTWFAELFPTMENYHGEV